MANHFHTQEASGIGSVQRIGYFLLSAFLIFFSAFPAVSYGREAGAPATEKTAILSIQTVKETKTAITLDINIDPGGQAINAVGTYLKYDPKRIEMQKLITENSFCDLFVEKEFQNSGGSLKFSCGKPYPGIDQPDQVVRLVFKKKSKGWTEIKFTRDTQVLANDGYGTDVTKTINHAKILLK